MADCKGVLEQINASCSTYGDKLRDDMNKGLVSRDDSRLIDEKKRCTREEDCRLLEDREITAL